MENQIWRMTMQLQIKATEKLSFECEGAYYPYDKTFKVTLKKGKNTLDFEDEAHYNRFIQAATSAIMDGLLEFVNENAENEEQAEGEGENGD